MAEYKIEIKKSEVNELATIPNKDQHRIVQKISSLAKTPRPPGCMKLSGKESYSIRMGKSRILYSVDDDALIILCCKNWAYKRSLSVGAYFIYQNSKLLHSKINPKPIHGPWSTVHGLT
jgi:mRNA interferase RelE/StbE